MTNSIGYCCKRCGRASPTGVGYVDVTVTASQSAQITTCACGYSQRPVEEYIVPVDPMDELGCDGCQ